ncbi:Zinc finger FYVE domain-containing protein 9 [Frankliniella fusca]|uniref:Zinc finger FYVE domain-containing protein 9 n=1 Tax=Frankliniella fusca TaxID=407009 RepID=A0AAE1LCN9_9NEOP|nr:Zinc finger FYVE domain-containing protein 9 [Frankliniella fusca]
MEKFAVDLDKVLDELEFNEDRAENLISSSGRRHSSGSSPLPQDHGVGSLHNTPQAPFDAGDNGSRWRPKPLPVAQKTSVSGVFSSLNEYLNSGRGTSVPSGNKVGNSNPETGELRSQPEETHAHSSTWSPVSTNELSPVDEKPDLIDSSILRASSPISKISSESADSNPSSNIQSIPLPDVAKTGTFLETAVEEDSSSSLDLISHETSASGVDCGQVIETDIKSESRTSSDQVITNVLSFGSLNTEKEFNDDELNDYLSDLELEEQNEGLQKHPQGISLALSKVDEKVMMQSKSESLPNSSVVKVEEAKLVQESTVKVDKAVIVPNSSDGSIIDEGSYNQTTNQCDLHEISKEFLVEDKEIVCESSCYVSESSSQLSSEFVHETYENSIGDADENATILKPETQAAHCDIDLEESLNRSEGSIGGDFKSSSHWPSHDNYDEAISNSTKVTDTSVSSLLPLPRAEDDIGVAKKIPLESVGLQDEGTACIVETASSHTSTEATLPSSSSSNDESLSSHKISEKIIPLSLSLDENIVDPSISFPSTPPTVPVTPTSQDPPAHEDFVSSISASSTPFMTPTAVLPELSDFPEDNSPIEGLAPGAVCSSDGSESNTNINFDPSQKPVRPSSLEIPTRTENAMTDTAISSEDSPAYDLTVGPPGATPSATRPSIAESLSEPSEPQGTDESATESSIDETLCGAVGGEEPSVSVSTEEPQLGKEAPFWVPDADAPYCMQCDQKFTVLKRRHHCRACGKVLCSRCCSEKAHLKYTNAEARVCVPCKSILLGGSSGLPISPQRSLHPNPNNPMEYCSTVSPLLQAAGSSQAAPTVMVPVGVLKREGSTKPKSEAKQVMFSDGIRPGADLAELDGSTEPRLSIRRTGRTSKRVGTPPGSMSTPRTLPPVDGTTMSYVPHGKGLPPVVIRGKDGIQFEEDPDSSRLMAVIQDESAPPVKFTINRNLYVLVKILNLDCCVNRVCWCFTSDGLSSVGQDEVVIILEVEPEEASVPKDIFIHLNTLFMEAAKGNTVTEMGHTLTQGLPFLGSREHGGFLYVRPTFQCLHRLILPPAPYLVGVLIHKWETPWAQVFPIRLMLRLGAEFRYYPCPLVSIRQRSAVYGEIGHTIIQILADFRNMAYTLPTVRGLVIHMEDKQTTILLPRNRYDQVMRALNNSNDHVLAFGANFSQAADSHLVCMQSDTDHSYHTQAINIHNKPRKATGASFVVFNGALKESEGMAAKSSIVEDGLMVKVTAETMANLKTALRNMKDISITCGPTHSTNDSSNTGAGVSANDEVVLIKWSEDDRSFNIGVLSSVDGRPLDGVPSIRVHNGTDYHGEYRFIRWTEVFILESEEGSGRTGDPVDISRLSEQLAKATCLALVKLLDLLAAANLTTLAVRATIHPENVEYQAGSNGEKLPPIYMNSLDNELVPVLHEAGLMSGESPAVLELVFRIMESG